MTPEQLQQVEARRTSRFDATRPCFTCPRCGRTSYHPDDVLNAYCGHCRAFMGDPKLETASFLVWLASECFFDVRLIGGGRWGAVKLFGHSVAVVTGAVGDKESMDGRWCYHRFDQARDALTAWGSTGYAGEPAGWFRNPATGRRVAEGPGLYDEHGTEVASGSTYVRW